MDAAEVRRAGLDYWEHVDVRVWDNWAQFEPQISTLGEAFFFSTKGARVYWDAPLGAARDVVLVFGRETGGLLTSIRERYHERTLAMPMMSPHVRSLNLSSAVGIALYEVLRQRAQQAANPGRIP